MLYGVCILNPHLALDTANVLLGLKVSLPPYFKVPD